MSSRIVRRTRWGRGGKCVRVPCQRDQSHPMGESTRPVAIVGTALLVASLLVAATGAAHTSQDATPPGERHPAADHTAPSPHLDRTRREAAHYVPGQLIVKFTPHLKQCAHCLLEKQQPFATALTDYTRSLDQLNQQGQVLAAQSVFVQRCEQTTVQAQATFQRKLEAIQRQFSKRTRRAPPTLVLPDLTNVYLLQVPPDAPVEQLCQLYAADPHVAYAQPNYLIQAQWVPNDPYYHSSGSWGQAYDDLWGLKKLTLEQAWDTTQGQGVVVAVVDTGVDYTHEDLATNIWTHLREIAGNGIDDDSNGFIDDTRGWSFADNTNDPMDRYGHGTHVAGTIAAVGHNTLGIIGVAPQAQIMPVKGLDDDGRGTIEDLAAGIVYAAQNGADVLNNSWGCGRPCPSNPVVEEAVTTAAGLGAVVVFAAGNSASDVSLRSPQNMRTPKPLVVAATRPDDTRAKFSNTGVLLDVSAPGVDILSLKSKSCRLCAHVPDDYIVGQDYLRLSGTSMAAPHAAGVAALVIAHRPTFTTDEVRQVLRASADDVESPSFDLLTGAGRLNAAKALRLRDLLTVQITAPASGATLTPQQGFVEIIGTATGVDFQQYALFFQRLGELQWTPIGSPSITPVTNTTLASWPIPLQIGTYLLRLSATSITGLTFEDLVAVHVEPLSRQLTQDLHTQKSPAIDGTRIVWTDDRNGKLDLYLYDLTTNTEQRITTDLASPFFEPAISGDRIVWMDDRHGRYDIYLYDLTTNTERQITTDPAYQSLPAISGDRIIWADGRHRDGNGDIYLYDLVTNTEQRITTDSASPFGKLAISGDRIVWMDDRNGKFDLYLYDLTTNTEQRITTDPADLVFGFFKLAISGDRIVWTDRRNDNFDIHLYDLATEIEQRLTAHPTDQFAPAISGNRIVWEDWRNGNADIFLYRLPNRPPVLSPIGDKRVMVGETLAFEVSATDPDEEPLTYSVMDVPVGARFTQGQFTWSPTEDQVGQHLVTFSVSDGTDITAETSTLTVDTYLVHRVHTTAQCESDGGTVYRAGSTLDGGAREPLACRFAARNCLSGWHRLRRWSTTQARRYQGDNCRGYDPRTVCTTGEHLFADQPTESCRYAHWIRGSGGHCSRQWRKGYAHVMEVGCY